MLRAITHFYASSFCTSLAVLQTFYIVHRDQICEPWTPKAEDFAAFLNFSKTAVLECSKSRDYYDIVRIEGPSISVDAAFECGYCQSSFKQGFFLSF